jgi:hypothetical protein
MKTTRINDLKSQHVTPADGNVFAKRKRQLQLRNGSRQNI